MHIVHAYGQGHQATPAPAPPVPPDTGSATYGLRVHSLLEEGNYAELESLAQINRSERGRFVSDGWRTDMFFSSLVWISKSSPLTDADYLQQSEKLKKWVDARPDSATAHIALAMSYICSASFARGSGYADTVSDRQWTLYHLRTAMAKQTLIEAATLKDRDPYWYFTMEDVAFQEGWDKADMRELLDQALAFEPDYYHFFRIYTTYLLPQWYGNPGEITAIAKEFASKRPEPDSSILYYWIVSGIACYCGTKMEEMKTADWRLLQSGFANLQAVYGVENLNYNRLAEMATIFQDKAVAHEAFSHVVERDTQVWLTEESFEQSRAWANSPGSQ